MLRLEGSLIIRFPSYSYQREAHNCSSRRHTNNNNKTGWLFSFGRSIDVVTVQQFPLFTDQKRVQCNWIANWVALGFGYNEVPARGDCVHFAVKWIYFDVKAEAAWIYPQHNAGGHWFNMCVRGLDAIVSDKNEMSGLRQLRQHLCVVGTTHFSPIGLHKPVVCTMDNTTQQSQYTG